MVSSHAPAGALHRVMETYLVRLLCFFSQQRLAATLPLRDRQVRGLAGRARPPAPGNGTVSALPASPLTLPARLVGSPGRRVPLRPLRGLGRGHAARVPHPVVRESSALLDLSPPGRRVHRRRRPTCTRERCSETLGSGAGRVPRAAHARAEAAKPCQAREQGTHCCLCPLSLPGSSWTSLRLSSKRNGDAAGTQASG